jgi:hypothetical protein
MDAPIYSELFGLFKAGMHNKMGDKVVQDFGLSREIMQEVMEGELINTVSLMESKLEIAQQAVCLVVGYARALRGEEIPKLEISGLLKHFSEGDKTVPKHVQSVIWGEVSVSTCGGGNRVQDVYSILGKASSGAEGEKWANAGFLMSA